MLELAPSNSTFVQPPISKRGQRAIDKREAEKASQAKHGVQATLKIDEIPIIKKDGVFKLGPSVKRAANERDVEKIAKEANSMFGNLELSGTPDNINECNTTKPSSNSVNSA